MGEMILAISHQWNQPLNALLILLRNLVKRKKENLLTDGIFDNLEQSQQIIKYLSKTIYTFKDFYISSINKHIFAVKKAIEITLFIIGTTFDTSQIIIKESKKHQMQ